MEDVRAEKKKRTKERKRHLNKDVMIFTVYGLESLRIQALAGRATQVRRLIYQFERISSVINYGGVAETN